MRKLKLFLSLLVLVTISIGNVWGTEVVPDTLFHETFGDNSSSARDWSDSYSVKSGVSTVYSGITGYTVSNAKQGKNTTGSTKSGLNQSTAGTDASIIIGPLNVSGYNTLKVTYQWKAASVKGTYSTKLEYKTSSTGTLSEVSGTGDGATSFVERSYNLPEAAQVSTLYLKITWNTSNTQAIIDEVELTGVAAAANPTVTLDPKVIDFGNVYKGETIDADTVVVVGANLTSALTATMKEGENSKFTVAPKVEGSLTPSDKAVNAKLVVTPNTETAGEFSDSIRINGGGLGADTARAFVKVNVKERVWTDDGADHDFGTMLQYGDKPEPYKFTLKGTHLTPGSEILVRNTYSTDLYDFSPSSITVDQNGEINQEVTISLKYTDYPSTMTNNVYIDSDEDNNHLGFSLFTVTTAVTVRYKIETTTDENGNTFEWTDGENANPPYITAGSSVNITATPKPAAGYAFKADSWDIYWTILPSEKVEHTNGAFAMPSADITISGEFEVSTTPAIAVSESAIAFGDVDYKSSPAAKTFTVSGAYLTAGDLTIACDNSAFDVTPSKIAVDGTLEATTVTVSAKTGTIGAFNGTITISGGGADNKTVAVSSNVTKLDAGLAWKIGEEVATAATVTIDADDNNFPQLEVADINAVVFSSTDPTVATISNEEGHKSDITLLKAGTTTIKATISGNEIYKNAEASYELTVQKEYTVEWWINGVKKVEQTDLPGEELLEIPDATKASKGAIYGKVFKGWAEAAIDGEVAADAAGIIATPTVMPNADKKYYAVYATEVPGSKTTKTDTLDYAFTGLGSATGYKDWSGKTGKSGAVYAGNSCALNTATVYIQMRSSSPSGIVTTTSGTGKVSEVRIKWTSSTTDGRYVTIFGKNTTAYTDPMNLYSNDTNTKGTSLGTIMKGTSTKLTISDEYDYVGILASAAIYMDTIEIDWTVTSAPSYKEYATSGPKLLNNPTFTVEEGTYTEAKSVAIEAGEGETIYYTLDGTDPTTASTEYTAAIELNKYGEYTIKAIAAKEDGSKSNVASATYKINVPFAKVSDLIDYVTNNSLTSIPDSIVVTGIISKVEEYLSNYKSITYWISDNGQTDVLKVYSGKNLNKADFSSVNDLNVGDKVTVKGKYLLYGNDDKVHELNYSNYILERTEAEVASIAIGGEATATEYEAGANFAFTGLTATATYNTGYVKVVTEEDDVWAASPATIAANTTSVAVTASYGGKTSEATEVAVTVKLHEITFEQPANGILSLYIDNGEEELPTTVSTGDKFPKGTVINVSASATDAYHKVVALKAGDENILEAKKFTVDEANITVVATIGYKDFESFEELVAAEVYNGDAGTELKVSFENVEITSIDDNEVYLNVKGSDGEDISIFCNNNHPEGWVVGGQLSGTLIAGTWRANVSGLNDYLEINNWTGITYKAPAPLSWNKETVDAYVTAKSYTQATLSNEQGLAVTYNSTDATVATIASDGKITMLKAGTTTIQAIFDGNDDYIAKTVSYTLNIHVATKLTLGGSLTKTEYESGEEFDIAGLTAILTFDNDATEDITDLATWTIDGEASVIVYESSSFGVKASYAGFNDNDSYNVTVKKHKVTFTAGNFVVKNGENAIASGDEFVKGTVLTVEAAEDYKLTALTANSVDILAAGQFEIGTEDVTLVVSTASYPAANISWASTEPLVLKKSEASSPANWRLLNNPGYFDVTVTSSNTDVIATMLKSGNFYYAEEVLSLGTTTITATFEGNENFRRTSVSYEVTIVDDIATGVDNTEAEGKAVKFIENGQIFILRGEKVYTITGELVK